MLRTIIIDDEEHQRKSIKLMADKYCPGLEVVATADGVMNGMEAIREHAPDLILLDIKLKDGTGFDLLELLHPIQCKVIFITAFDHYAIRAFRYSALDYLLKPVDIDELCQAVGKASKSVQKDFNLQLNHFRKLMEPTDTSPVKIIVKTFSNIYLIPVKDILFCESDNNYTRFHLTNDQHIMVSVTLKNYEEILSESGFFRVHRKYLINLTHIKRFEKTDSGVVVLGEEIKIPVSSRKRSALLVLIDHLTNT